MPRRRNAPLGASNGSMIRSPLIGLLAEACAAGPGLNRPSTRIEDTGEVNWLVADARIARVQHQAA